MNKKGGVLVTTYFSFNDALIQAYTLPYVRLIRKLIPVEFPVYLLTIEKDTCSKISVQDKINLSDEGITLISLQYQRFGLGLLKWIPSLISYFFIARSKKIQTIHAWCTTGGLIGYLFSILSGKKLVLDSFEPHAEVMLETKTWAESSLKYKTLFIFEKLMAKKANVHICCTSDMKAYAFRKYGIELKQFFVKPACVDLKDYPENFRKEKNMLLGEGLEGKIVCVYAGKFGGLYLSNEVFDFFKEAYNYWGDRFRVLLLSNETAERIKNWCKNSDVPLEIIVQKFVPHASIPQYLGLADFGLAPYQSVPSRKYGAPIKVSEYFASGLPVVITANIADDSKLILEQGIGAVLSELNRKEYLNAVKLIDDLLKENAELLIYRKIKEIALKERSFSIAAQVYNEIYT